tara:strand:+ start:1515 stop:1901 length:387 start_codon:yes stop_codon:yes gene_type:complete
MNNIKSITELVVNASKEIKTISASEAKSLSDNGKCNLIDIRDALELKVSGSIDKAINISRGLLEFSLNSESPLIRENKIDLNKEIILFCAAGGRSALAAKTLQDMGFEKVSHIEGGFASMSTSGFKIK